MDEGKMGQMLMQHKNVVNTHLNREGIYKWFIENFSKRTYRCPLKKIYRTALGKDALAKLSLG